VNSYWRLPPPPRRENEKGSGPAGDIACPKGFLSVDRENPLELTLDGTKYKAYRLKITLLPKDKFTLND
jgi:hypothetical protein